VAPFFENVLIDPSGWSCSPMIDGRMWRPNR
jgi:hypothetical protein